jgi:hypothetical protein
MVIIAHHPPASTHGLLVSVGLASHPGPHHMQCFDSGRFLTSRSSTTPTVTSYWPAIANTACARAARNGLWLVMTYSPLCVSWSFARSNSVISQSKIHSYTILLSTIPRIVLVSHIPPQATIIHVDDQIPPTS